MPIGPIQNANHKVRRYHSKGREYCYHAELGVRLPDLPNDHPDMLGAIRTAEANSATGSDAAQMWGGTTQIDLQDTLEAMIPPTEPTVIAFTVPQIIRFIFKSNQGHVVYYHHGNLLEDARREPAVRQKGKYIALCVEFGLLGPRQKRGHAGDSHYYAVRTGQILKGLPNHVITGAITPDEYIALRAIDERQASLATSRAIRDALGVSDGHAKEMRRDFINRNWLTNTRPPDLTELGQSLLS